ncbi:hypothetical protein AZE42_10668 [Rhizopogon vesiculosus]|uniref:Uncharacterized protein n=1 Tax=Rhizopogon vesiculosus TaxID=180088 RepID=A0A1J8QLU4_9AGAM|nr:hypothetical protein AZE42_10668 [Rhizopogon vesiculosus]
MLTSFRSGRDLIVPPPDPELQLGLHLRDGEAATPALGHAGI